MHAGVVGITSVGEWQLQCSDVSIQFDELGLQFSERLGVVGGVGFVIDFSNSRVVAEHAIPDTPLVQAG